MDTVQKIKENICVLLETLNRWKKLLDKEEMLYLYAMTGYGKTTQVLVFADKEYAQSKRISAAEHNFLEQMESCIDTYEKTKIKTLLILDDLQWIFAENERKELFDCLLRIRKNRKVHVFLVSRASVPTYLSPFQVTRQLAVENEDSLKLDVESIRKIMMTYPSLVGIAADKQEKAIKKCVELARGYPLGINAFFQRLTKTPDDVNTAAMLAINDVQDYLEIHLFGEWTAIRKDAAIRLSVYDSFNFEMAKEILGEPTEATIHDFLEVGSFLEYKAPDTYLYVPFFREFLEKQLIKRPEKEWMPLYETAGACYEKQRSYEQALRCYRKADRKDKIAELVVILSENAEGCAFARIAQEYIGDLSDEWETREPRILGAKVMLAAYRMQPQECMQYLAKLKKMADEEKCCVMQGNALEAYVRTAIACPYDTADKLKDNMLYFLKYVRHNGFHLKNIMPTGNMPSLINGGLDLLPWEKNKKLIYPVVKSASELIMGEEAIGIADASMGEILYEQNQLIKSMGYLTKALSAANYNGSIRVQYAVTAIMARLFQSEGQSDTAKEIFHNLLKKVKNVNFNELIPNLQASFAYTALMNKDMAAIEEWLAKYAPNEHDTFFITARFQLIIKARVYVVMGKTLEAMYILDILEEFAKLYKRTYFYIEILILKAIIMNKRDEEWKETLLSAVELAEPYGLVRIFADQGAALLPLWKTIDWDTEDIQCKKHKVITKEMKQMALFYPGYLKRKHQYMELSKKEKEVLTLMSEGYNNAKIAQNLEVNLGTVKFHVSNIMKKLEAENRTVAVKVAKEEGIL